MSGISSIEKVESLEDQNLNCEVDELNEYNGPKQNKAKKLGFKNGYSDVFKGIVKPAKNGLKEKA